MNSPYLFDQTFKNASIGMAIVSPEGKFVQVNPALCGLLGYTEAELTGREPKAITHPADLAQSREVFRQVRSAALDYTQVEKRYIHKSGRVVWVLLIISVVRDEHGNILYVYDLVLDVTERKSVELQQQKQAEQWHYLMRHHPDILATLSPEGKILNVNDNCERILGYSREAYKRIDPSRMLDDESRARASRHFAKAMQGQGTTFELTMRHRQGYPVQLAVTYVPMTVGEEIAGIFAISKDITNFRETERKLQEHEEHYRSLFVNNPDGILHKDRYGYILAANPAMERISGYGEAELRRMSYSDLTIQEDLAESRHYFRKVLTGEPCQYEKRIRHKAGHFIHCSFTYVPIKVGLEIVGVYGIVKDITQLKDTEEKLRHHVEMLDLVSEYAPDIISYSGPDFRVQYVSPSVKAIVGYEPEEVIGHTSYEYMHPEDAKALSEQRPFAEKDTLVTTTRQRHKAGHYIWLESITRAIRDEDGNILRYFGIGRDITERKQVEQLMLQSEKLSIAGQLAAGIAHEIRNPLTAIKGFLKLLERQMHDKPYYFEVIDSEMTRIEAIVTELLILAKPQAVSHQVKDIRRILEQVIVLMETEANLNNLQFRMLLEDRGLYISCDENQLKQVFINFLKNAIDASESGGVITIRADKRGEDRIRIRIADEGTGIPAEVLARLGEPFYTTKEKGTGLGFMVSKKIIEEHNGTLSVKSRVGEGTRIEIALPAAPPAEEGSGD